MNAQVAHSVEQRERLFRVLQDDAVQFVCEILFDPVGGADGGFDRGLQDVVLANLGAYLEALRARVPGRSYGETPCAWFEAMLTDWPFTVIALWDTSWRASARVEPNPMR